MIISCISCNKKFEVNSSLIPEKGRTLQCGSCNKVWFYTPDLINSLEQSPAKKIENNDTTLEDDKNISESIFSQHQNEASKEEISYTKKNTTDKKLNQNNLIKKKNIFRLSNFLSFFLVLLISFTALIITLDTFKLPLGNIFPNLEMLLYNLFETIKDIHLFSKNLIK